MDVDSARGVYDETVDVDSARGVYDETLWMSTPLEECMMRLCGCRLR